MPTEFDPALILVGLLMPPFVALIKQSGFSQQINAAIALVVYLAATIVYLWYQGIPITLDSYAANATALTVVGLAAYKMFWSGLGVDTPLTAKTSIKKAPPE